MNSTARNFHGNAAPKKMPVAQLHFFNSNWSELARAVRETLAEHWHSQLQQSHPKCIRLILSLNLLPDPLSDEAERQLRPLVEWMALQCGRVYVTASHKPEHRLYLD